MMAKIGKGGRFSGATKYVLNPDKEAELIDAEGLRLNDVNSIIHSFLLQSELNPRISKPVGHISLNFSSQDKEKLSNEFMRDVARDYMDKMGIKDTQYFIGRHFDKEHPHIHIIYNRIDNNGLTITDKNERFRNEKICKELTAKYGLYHAKGKENVNRHRLKEPDKSKYEIYDVLKREVPKAKSWKELTDKLNQSNIGVEFKMRSGTNEPQGVKFSNNGYSFNGSKIDREFSFTKIDAQIQQNATIEKSCEQSEKQTVSDISSAIAGGFDLLNDNPAVDVAEEDFIRRMQRKKKGIKR